MAQGQKLEDAPAAQRGAEALIPHEGASFAPDVLFAAALVGDEPTPAAPAPDRRRANGAVAVSMLVVALLLVALARGILLRALLPIALAIVAVTLLLKKRQPRRRLIEQPARSLTIERGRLTMKRLSGSDLPLFDTGRTFGVALVSSRRRDRLVAVLTSAAGTLLVGTRLSGSARAEHAELLSRSVAVANDDAGLDAVGPDGEPLRLAPEDFASLVRTLVRVDPGCLDRLVLSDPGGAPVVLDGTDLLVRDLRFDLSAPLEWRSILFQEAFGHAVAVYQGTWVRQGGFEVVLVALLPSIAVPAPSSDETTGLAELDRAASRDLRLHEASPDEPPPNDRRVAIDRVFVLPLRAALDRAPRPSSHPLSARPA